MIPKKHFDVFVMLVFPAYADELDSEKELAKTSVNLFSESIRFAQMFH